MSVTKVSASSAFVFAVSVLAFGARAGAARNDEETRPGSAPSSSLAALVLGDPQQGEAAGEADTDAGKIRVQGRVLGPEGEPFVGAKLYLGGSAGPKGAEDPIRATSGADGRFAFDFSFPGAAPDSRREDDAGFQVLAVAAGFGCNWATINSAAQGEVTLRLVKDAPVMGRIIDAEGKPITGAKLTLTGVAAAKGPGGQPAGRGWIGRLPGQPGILTTARDGCFRLDGIGRDRVATFRLESPGLATASLRVTGNVFEHEARVSRPIRGVIRDKDTRKPLAGAFVISGLCEAVADEDGRYELLGVAKAARYHFALKPAPGQPYIHRDAEAQDTPGLEPLTADFGLVRATVTLHGKVTDRATGKPVVGAKVDYRPVYGNDAAAKMEDGSSPRADATTGADGSYAVAVMPGPGVIRVAAPQSDAYMPAWVTLKERRDFFKSHVQEYEREGTFLAAMGSGGIGMFGLEGHHAVVLLDPVEREEALVRDVMLERGQHRQCRVVGPDDQPLIGVTVQGLLPSSHVVEALQGADFTVRGINPQAPPRLLTFYHEGKNLGSFLKGLPAETDGPLIVKLQPCGSLSGRIVDQDGQPVPGFRGTLKPGNLHRHDFTTDKEGHFRVEGILPGLGYSVWQAGKRTIAQIHPDAVVDSGSNKDLKDIKAIANN
jgi:protocatechuate 3,4-dioxygenase beta subunit